MKLDYKFYITNQICKPVSQIYALVLEDLDGFNPEKSFENSRIIPPVFNFKQHGQSGSWVSEIYPRLTQVVDEMFKTVDLGDMSGGFNTLKDIYKVRVYEMARWRNTAKPADALGPDGIVIPVNTIEKPPSAELRPDQTDQDSILPLGHHFASPDESPRYPAEKRELFDPQEYQS